MDEADHSKPHPVSGRQEKNVLAPCCSSGSTCSTPGADETRFQKRAGTNNGV